MSAYEAIDHTFACFLSTNVGLSESEAIATARARLKSNSGLRTLLTQDVARARHDLHFSWKAALAEFDVAFFDDEARAMNYGISMLEAILTDDAPPADAE